MAGNKSGASPEDTIGLLKRLPPLDFFIPANPGVVDELSSGEVSRETLQRLSEFAASGDDRAYYVSLMGTALAPSGSRVFKSSLASLTEQLQHMYSDDDRTNADLYAQTALDVAGSRPEVNILVRTVMRNNDLDLHLTRQI
jgi:hypothetical protein